MLACAASQEPRPSPAVAVAPEPTVAASAPAVPSATLFAPDVASDAVTQVGVLEPEALRALEGSGFDFARVAVDQAASTTAELSRLPSLRSLFATLRADVKAA